MLLGSCKNGRIKLTQFSIPATFEAVSGIFRDAKCNTHLTCKEHGGSLTGQNSKNKPHLMTMSCSMNYRLTCSMGSKKNTFDILSLMKASLLFGLEADGLKNDATLAPVEGVLPFEPAKSSTRFCLNTKGEKDQLCVNTSRLPILLV